MRHVSRIAGLLGSRLSAIGCGALGAMMTIALYAPPAVAQSGVKVHLEPSERDGGFIDAESKRREDSTFDLQKELAKDKTLWLTTTDRTDVVLRVVSSAEEETGEIKTESRKRPEIVGGGYRTESTKETAYVVRVLLTVGTYKREIVGQSKGDIPTWTGAAQEAAKQIRQWINDNRQQLCGQAATAKSCWP